MGGKGSQTIGYHYLMSMMMGLGRGPIDELVQITVGDEVAWDGSLCEGTPAYINKPELFGGEKKEGGVQGPFALYNGASDQVLPETDVLVPGVSGGAPGSGIIGLLGKKVIKNGLLPALRALVPGRVSQLRGTAIVWFDGLVTSMNPYPKDWKFRVRRTTAGWYGGVAWYPAKAAIYLNEGKIRAMNGAHIVYECVTNPEWGRGLDEAFIDQNSFIYAANQLCAEGFGLCFTWYRKEDIDQFIQVVIDHIGATLYTDRETGLLTLRLIRDDYDVDDLPLFTEDSGLLSILEDDSASADTQFNEVIVTGHDPITNTDIVMRAQSLAGWQSQGAASTMDQKYPGLPTGDLCARVALRDAKTQASGLKKYKVSLDRRGFRIAPGMPFRISSPRRGLANIVLRAGEIDDGKMLDGRIDISAVQDVFGMPDTAFTTWVPSTWVPPSQVAAPPLDSRMVEIDYRTALLRRSESEAQAVLPTEAFAGMLAAAPDGLSTGYRLLTKVTGETDYGDRGLWDFTATGRLGGALLPLTDSVLLIDLEGLPDDLAGTVMRVDDELIGIIYLDSITRVATLKRGAVDTIPASHSIGTRVYFQDDDIGLDPRTYAPTETVTGKALTATNRDELSENNALEKSVVLEGRIAKPYPPANVRIRDPHRYWRLYITSNFAEDPMGELGVGTFRLYGISGEDHTEAVGAVVTADSDLGGPYVPGGVNSGTEVWATDPPFPHWLQWDLGEPKVVNSFLVYGRYLPYNGQSPRDFILQWSDDEVTWTDFAEYEDQNPYLPDGIEYDVDIGSSIFLTSGTYTSPTLYWVERNRLTQGDNLVGHTEPTIAPEAGTTYRVTVYNGDTQIGLYTGITDTFFNYDPSLQAADGASGTVRLVLQTERDGLLSRPYGQDILVSIIIGYGYGYGTNYGGVE